jgi:hypothetical protein
MSALTSTALLAQETVENISAQAQLQYFLSVLLTPTGIALALAGSGAIGIVLITGRGFPIFMLAAMFCLTTMLQDVTLTKNVLIGPLQSLRNVARPLALGLLLAASLTVLQAPSGSRGRIIGFTAASFLGFQLLFLSEMLIGNPGKAVLAFISIPSMFFVCAVGFGRRMQDRESTRASLEIFAWLTMAFIGANMAQLVIDRSNAIVGSRLTGIAGNAQQMGGVCTMLLLFNVYLFNDLPSRRPLRWVCSAMIGILALWIIWTGSRASVLTTMVGLLCTYRLRIGKLALLGLAAGAVLLVAMSLFEESTETIQRLTSGENTRAAVWAWSLGEFAGSPIFGTMPLGYESGSESSYVSALANMGIIGGLALLVPFGSMALGALRALRLRAMRPDLGAQCDLYVGMVGALLVINAFEAFAFGVLSLPVMIMYSMFALDGFLSEQEELASAGYGLPGTAEDPDYAYP